MIIILYKDTRDFFKFTLFRKFTAIKKHSDKLF